MRKLICFVPLLMLCACTNSGHVSGIGLTVCNNQIAVRAALVLAEKEAEKLPDGIGKDTALATIDATTQALAFCPTAPVPAPSPTPAP